LILKGILRFHQFLYRFSSDKILTNWVLMTKTAHSKIFSPPSHIENIKTIINEKKKVNEEFDNKMKAEIDGLVSAFTGHLENAHAVFSILTSSEIGQPADELLKNVTGFTFLCQSMS